MNVAHSPIQWGTAPAAVGSILTGFSLLLGFSILWRDRRKEERRQAAQLSCFLVSHSSGDVTGAETYKAILYMHNASQAMISSPVFYAEPKKKNTSLERKFKMLPRGRTRSDEDAEGHQSSSLLGQIPEFWQLFPGEHVQLELTLDAAQNNYIYFVEFQDALNKGWRLYPTALKLKRRRTPRRTKRAASLGSMTSNSEALPS
jgi:hypothetical protein